MARTPLQVDISLDTIRCYKQSDWGSAEPYLWTIYFKIDGDTVVMGDDLFLHGTATVVTTPGSHGNLGDTDVDEGDDVPVPSAIGEFQTVLKPIPVPDFLGVDDVGGVVGVAVVLMEEDWVSDSGAEAGHAALNTFVQQAIDQLIPTLGVSNPDVTDAEIAALTAHAADAVSDAVRAAQGFWRNVASWLNGDDELGAKTFTFSHDSLAADAFQDVSQRFTTTITEHFPPNPPITIVTEDWELLGRIQGIQQCPSDAASAVLTKMKLLSAKDARHAAAAAREFRKRAFAGRRGLGLWWELAERNVASIAGILNRNPDLAKRSAAAAVIELSSAVRSDKGALSETFLTHVEEVLTVFAKEGTRRLRRDSAATLGVLPELRGKSLREITALLDNRPPTRKRYPRQGAGQA
jgi:hypothetical protein